MAMKSEQTAGVDPRSGRAMLRRDAAFWVQAMAEQRASGFGVERFCHERGLARSTFQKWMVRLKRGAMKGLAATKAKASVQAMEFVPLPMPSGASAALSAEAARVDIVLEAGMKLTLSGAGAYCLIDALVARIAGTTQA